MSGKAYGKKPENVPSLRGWLPHCGGDEWQSGGGDGLSYVDAAAQARLGDKAYELVKV